MIDSIWGIFTIGLLLGAPSGIAPGPMLILIISETLRHGIPPVQKWLLFLY